MTRSYRIGFTRFPHVGDGGSFVARSGGFARDQMVCRFRIRSGGRIPRSVSKLTEASRAAFDIRVLRRIVGAARAVFLF
jgi:hypothetical protein